MASKVLGATDRVLNALKKAEGLIEKQSELTQDVHTTPEDVKIDLANQQLVPVRVVSGNGITGYICDIFEKGLSEPATKQGRVFLANGASTIYTLPVGTVMYAQRIVLEKIGTSD